MPNKMERFTQRARRVLGLAQEEAARLQHMNIGTEHLLLGLMREDGGVAGRVLRDLGIDPRRLQEVVERLTRENEQATSQTQVDLSPGTKKVLELAVDEARRMGHHYIGTEHLLLGLVRQSEGVAIETLKRLGVSPEEVRRQTRRVLEEAPVKSPSSAETSQTFVRTRLLAQSAPSGTSLVELLVAHLVTLSNGGFINLKDLIKGLTVHFEGVSTQERYDTLIDTLYAAIKQYAEAQNIRYVLTKSTHLVAEKTALIRIPIIGLSFSETVDAPPQDFVVDIADPGDKIADIEKRVQEYFGNGTKLIWMVYPLSKLVMAYHSDGKITAYDVSSTLDAGDLLPGFALPVRALFTDL